MNDNTRISAHIAMLLAVLFWGVSYVGTKLALDGFPPLSLAFLRFAFAGLLFALVLALRGWPETTRVFHRKVATLACFLPGLYFIFENYGIKYTTAGKASMIIAMVPVAVSLLSVLVLGEKLTLKRILSLALSLAGIYLLLLYGKGGGSLFEIALGDLLMFGAVGAAAVYMLLTRKLCAEYDPILITSFQMIYGGLFFTPFFLFEVGSIDWVAVNSEQWGALLILTLFSSVGAFFTYNYALKFVPASRASLFVNIVPFVTVLTAWGLLGERLSVPQLGGGLLVIVAAFLASTPDTEPTRETLVRCARKESRTPDPMFDHKISMTELHNPERQGNLKES